MKPHSLQASDHTTATPLSLTTDDKAQSSKPQTTQPPPLSQTTDLRAERERVEPRRLAALPEREEVAACARRSRGVDIARRSHEMSSPDLACSHHLCDHVGPPAVRALDRKRQRHTTLWARREEEREAVTPSTRGGGKPNGARVRGDEDEERLKDGDAPQ